MRVRLVYFSIIFFILSGIAFSQEPSVRDKIEDKAVIGFPGITTQQLTAIGTEFAKYPQVVSAKYISGAHNCMLITFNNEKNFTVYAELLKVISGIYNIDQCYFKPKSAFAEITELTKPGTEFIVK